MGTSSSSNGTSGKGTPLIPSWLDTDGDVATQPSPNEGTGTPAANSDTSPPPSLQELPPIPEPADPKRFRAPRANFSKFVRSGGTDRASLGRSVGGYISSTAGGAKNASRSMGSSRVAGTRLLGFLSDAAQNGALAALDKLNLGRLVGRPIAEIFTGLMDHILPVAGTVDAGVARDAFIDATLELAENGINDLDNLTIDQLQTTFEIYLSNTIETRLYNEIGTNLMAFSATTDAAQNAQTQVHEFVRNGVADALDGRLTSLDDLADGKIASFVDGVYEQAFLVLESLADAESNET